MAEHDDSAHETLSEAAEPEPIGHDADDAGGADAEPTPIDQADVDIEDYDDVLDAESPDDTAAQRTSWSPLRLGAVVGVVAVAALGSLAGWTGYQDHRAQQARHDSELLVQVARQGALNLTTVDWKHADADVQRILDSATGAFYDDFSGRSKPFIEVIKKAQSTSVGTITEAGLESHSGAEADVLVALSVKSSVNGAQEQEPRNWRMRISVRKQGNEAKVFNVAFVP